MTQKPAKNTNRSLGTPAVTVLHCTTSCIGTPPTYFTSIYRCRHAVLYIITSAMHSPASPFTSNNVYSQLHLLKATTNTTTHTHHPTLYAQPISSYTRRTTIRNGTQTHAPYSYKIFFNFFCFATRSFFLSFAVELLLVNLCLSLRTALRAALRKKLLMRPRAPPWLRRCVGKAQNTRDFSWLIKLLLLHIVYFAAKRRRQQRVKRQETSNEKKMN